MLRWALIGCVVLVPAYMARGQILTALARWLDVGQEPEKTDCVLILLGGEDTRPFVAAALVGSGLVSQVLLNQVELPDLGEPSLYPPPHEIAERVLQIRGVPAEKIIRLPRVCHNTFEEATNLADYLDAHPSARVTVVTNHFHTRRARWVFRKVVGHHANNLRFVSAPTDGFDETNWWRDDRGFILYSMEYLKFAFYLVRYGYGGGWCLALLLIMVGGIVARRRYRRLKSKVPALRA